MGLFCRKKLTPLQRRSIGGISVVMFFMVAANILTQFSPTETLTHIFPFLSVLVVRPGHAPLLAMAVAMIVALFPVLLAVLVAGHYLAKEPDEFIRSMVMQALLWGMACTMAADGIASVWMAAQGSAFPVGMINADVFVIAAGVSFRLVTWRFSR